MSCLEEYRDTDYDIDVYFDRTTSCPDGVKEKYQFEPNLPRAVQRVSSADNIQSLKDYFYIARKNQGGLLTWKHYLRILGDDLRHFNTAVLMSKAFLERLSSPPESEISHYSTASESSSEKTISDCKILKRETLDEAESFSDFQSILSSEVTSLNSSVSFTQHKKLLRSFFSDIRQLASKTYRTVEKISSKSRRCVACGEYFGSTRSHGDECSTTSLKVTHSKKDPALGMVKNTNLTRTLSLLSTMSTGSGESTVNPLYTNQLATRKKKKFPIRMLSFLKKDSKKIVN